MRLPGTPVVIPGVFPFPRPLRTALRVLQPFARGERMD